MGLLESDRIGVLGTGCFFCEGSMPKYQMSSRNALDIMIKPAIEKPEPVTSASVELLSALMMPTAESMFKTAKTNPIETKWRSYR